MNMCPPNYRSSAASGFSLLIYGATRKEIRTKTQVHDEQATFAFCCLCMYASFWKLSSYIDYLIFHGVSDQFEATNMITRLAGLEDWSLKATFILFYSFFSIEALNNHKIGLPLAQIVYSLTLKPIGLLYLYSTQRFSFGTLKNLKLLNLKHKTKFVTDSGFLSYCASAEYCSYPIVAFG